MFDEIYAWVRNAPRDLDQHAEKIRELTSRVKHVTAFVKRREWNVLLAAGRPKSLIVHQTEADPLLDACGHSQRTSGQQRKAYRGLYDARR